MPIMELIVNKLNGKKGQMKQTGTLTADGKVAGHGVLYISDGAGGYKVWDGNVNQGALSPADSPTSVTDGNKTVTAAGTAEKLVPTATPCNYVMVEALLANTGVISVGGSTTTPSGTVKGRVLNPGSAAMILINDVSKVYINSTVNGEGVSFSYG